MSSKKGFSSIFVLLVVILLGTVGFGTFYYFKGRLNISPSLVQKSSDLSSIRTSQPEQIKVIDGSVYKITSDSKQELLIKKGKYSNGVNANEDVTFNEVKVSPDTTKLLVLGNSGIHMDYLYYTSLSKVELKFIDFAQEAVWSNNSQYIAYNGKAADAGPLIWVKIFDTNLSKNVDFSNKPYIANLRYDFLGFTNLKWANDDSGVYTDYVAYQGNDIPGKEIGQGNVLLPVAFSDVTAHWKTYSSLNNHFSIKYPFYWIYSDKNTTITINGKQYTNATFVEFGEPYKGHEYINPSNNPKTTQDITLTVTISPDFKNINVRDLTQDFGKDRGDTKKTITINKDIQGVEHSYACQNYCTEVLFIDGNTFYDFSTGPNSETEFPILHQMLSTYTSLAKF